jgi:hypothetical protein
MQLPVMTRQAFTRHLQREFALKISVWPLTRICALTLLSAAFCDDVDAYRIAFRDVAVRASALALQREGCFALLVSTGRHVATGVA